FDVGGFGVVDFEVVDVGFVGFGVVDAGVAHVLGVPRTGQQVLQVGILGPLGVEDVSTGGILGCLREGLHSSVGQILGSVVGRRGSDRREVADVQPARTQRTTGQPLFADDHGHARTANCTTGG